VRLHIRAYGLDDFPIIRRPISKPLVDRIPFAKILIGLAILFGLSLGLCGLGIAQIWNGKSVPPGMDRLMNQAAGYDMLAMVLSAAGLLATAIIRPKPDFRRMSRCQGDNDCEPSMTEDCPANIDLMKPVNLIEGGTRSTQSFLRRWP